MNAKREASRRKCTIIKLTGLSFAVWISPCSTAALEVVDIIEDPLFTNPSVLKSGALLPGDEFPALCPGQTELGRVLTLSDAVDQALCKDPQIKASWAAIKIQAGLVGEARAAYLPTVNGTYSVLRNRTEYLEFPDSNTTQKGHTSYMALNWRLFDFDGRSANRKSANQLLVAALASHDARVQKTLSLVIAGYFDALTASATAAARSRATQLANDTLGAAQRRQAQGAAGRNDSLQAATALAKAQLAEQRALGESHKALSTLAYAIGLPAGAVIKLADVDSVLPNEAISELAQWLMDAQSRHPAILAAQAQLESAKEKIAVVRSEGLPTIDWVTNFSQNGYPNQGLQSTKSKTTTFGLTVTLPLFDGFARSYKIRGAEAQAEQSEAQLRDVENQILTEVVKAYSDAVASLANLTSSERLLASARESDESSRRRFDKGAADILERLSVQSALIDAEQERIRCLSEWRSAKLRLMANSGLLGRLSIAAVTADLNLKLTRDLQENEFQSRPHLLE